MNLPWSWLTAGSCKALWGDDACTYKKIAYEALPPLAGTFDGSFSWLAAAPLRPDGMCFEFLGDEHLEELIGSRVAEANQAGLVVPAAFVKFMRDEILYKRIPSCTACYWELGARLVPLPEHEGPERLLRFMNDQQTCVAWYLLLAPDGSHRVAYAWPEWNEDGEGDSLEDLMTPGEVTVCAPSFETFIKRFWIENTLWDAVHRGERLTGELLEYSKAAAQAVASG